MKVLVADDHALFRDGLKLQLNKIDAEAEVIESKDFAETFKVISENSDIDLVLLDLNMPGNGWEDALVELMDKLEEITKIIVLSASENYADIKKVLDLGAVGYIPKGSDTKVLVNALKLVMEGGTYLPPAMLSANIGMTADSVIKEAKKLLPNGKSLTSRQLEVLNFLGEGLSNKQIAYEMNVSEATVKLHINALLRNLSANNRTQAVVTAQKMGFI